MHHSPKLTKINLERIKQSKPGGTWHDWEDKLILKAYRKKVESHIHQYMVE